MSSFALERHPSVLYGAAAIGSAAVGVLIATTQQGIPLALVAFAALAGIVVLLSVPPQTLFVGWLFVAPVFADSTQASSLGHALALGFYMLPALLLALLTAAQLRDGASVSFVDLLPAAYVAYVLSSIFLSSEVLQTSMTRTLTLVFLTVALGPCLYYFLVVGPGSMVDTRKLSLALMYGAVLQGVLALVETATHWNLWGYTVWQNTPGGLRAVSTLANPGILGAYLGIGIVFAIAILTWGGPRSLRRLAVLTLVACFPALLATLTRGPIVATMLAVLLLLVLGRKRLFGIALIASAVLFLVIAWPHIRSSAVYQDRAADIETVRVRQGLQKLSLDLAAQKPVFGWGYASFDRVKNSKELPSIDGLPVAFLLESTSHNTYLTILVELGVFGVLLLLIPFATILARALSARVPTTERWLVAAASGSLVVLMLTGMTLDYRFFSFVPALSWIMLAILRRLANESKPLTSMLVA